MEIEMGLLLSFTNFFDEEPPLNIEELIRIIPMQDILKFSAYISATLHSSEGSLQVQEFLLEQIRISLPAIPIRRLNEGEFVFIHYTCLKLISMALEQASPELIISESVNNDISPEHLLLLFKTYLLLNQELLLKQDARAVGEAQNDKERLIHEFITIHLPLDEFVNLKGANLQLIKGNHLFKFMNNNSLFSKYLPLLFNKYGVDSGQDYLKHLLSLYFHCIKTEPIPSRLSIPHSEEFGTKFFDAFSFNVGRNSEPPEWNDFLSIRNYPFFKLTNQEYVILNFNFLIDRFFQGIYFQLKELIEPISSSDAKRLHGVYSGEFIEKKLFFWTMDACLAKHPNVERRVQNPTVSNNEYSDYYLRVGDDIFLFEMKNSMVRADTKSSYNFELIKEKISQKFVVATKEGQKPEAKAVRQLVNSIVKMGDNGFPFDPFDKQINTFKLIIHPIIVFTDDCLDTDGVNHLLNQIFQDEMKPHTFRFMRIAPLAMINLDDLMRLIPLFQNRLSTFNQIFNEYDIMTAAAAQNNTNTPDGQPHDFWEYISFDNFIRAYLKHRRLPTEEMLDNWLLAVEFPGALEQQ